MRASRSAGSTWLREPGGEATAVELSTTGAAGTEGRMESELPRLGLREERGGS